MRIVVVLGRVLDPRGITVNRRVGRVFVNREEYITQPADRCALEAALAIKERADAEVIAVPRGILPDPDILRVALATGADRAIHFVSPGGMASVDDAGSALLVAAAIDRLGGADLVLVGGETLDMGQGQLGPRLAEALGWPQVLAAWQVAVSDGRLRAVVKVQQGARTTADSYHAVVVNLPCVVTVAAGALKLRYPDGVQLINVFRGVGATASALEEWDVADLVDPASLAPCWEWRGQRFPPERERGTHVRGTSQEMVEATAVALRERMRT